MWQSATFLWQWNFTVSVVTRRPAPRRSSGRSRTTVQLWRAVAYYLHTTTATAGPGVSVCTVTCSFTPGHWAGCYMWQRSFSYQTTPSSGPSCGCYGNPQCWWHGENGMAQKELCRPSILYPQSPGYRLTVLQSTYRHHDNWLLAPTTLIYFQLLMNRQA